METINVKQGDTFTFIYELKDADGNNMTGRANDMSCEVRKDVNNELVSTATITETTTEGVYSVVVDDTSAWPTNEMLLFDIKIVIDSVVKHTDIIQIDTERSITT